MPTVENAKAGKGVALQRKELSVKETRGWLRSPSVYYK